MAFHVRRPTRRSWPWALVTLALLAGAAAHGEDRVYASPEAVEPLEAGERVPSARVRNVAGESVDLAALVRDGALLVFYRGGW